MDSITVTAGQKCDHNEITIDGKDATCTENGLTEGSRCLICGEWFEEQEEIPATGHTYGDWIVDVEPTEEAEGLQHKECANCDDIVEDILPTLSHEHSYTPVVTAPTCTAQGYTTYTCACGETYDADYVDMIAHTYESAVTNPTCTAEGYTTYICSVCGDTYKDNTVPALGHADEDGNYKCDTCSAIVAPAADSALTIEQAITLGKLYSSDTYTADKYYVTGIITEVYNDQYGNMYITDASGKKLTIYGLYDATGKTRYDAMTVKPGAGDEITVYGIIGQYGNNAQIKNGWLDELVACEHVYEVTKEVAATCTANGSITKVCTVCELNTITETIEALGHTTEEGTCERCDEEIGGSDAPAEPTVLATFNLGANGSASHNDGSGSKATYSETANGYTLSITGGTNLYTGARDAKGNSCIKLGTSSKAGSFSLTVGADVNKVVIYVAAYKSKTATIDVNGTKTTLTKKSDNGEYDVIEIDTSTTKTITLKVSSGYRAMVNTIEFWS